MASADDPRPGRGAVFPIAPMSGVMLGMTVFVLLLAPLFMILGAALQAPGFGLVGGFLGATYVIVFLAYRPTAFALDEAGFWVLFPLRRRHVPWAEITGARAIAAGAIRGELGIPIRVGVGGLWGVFGLLYTTKRGWVSVYLTRQDGLLLLERGNRRPVLMSPTDPDRFRELVTEGRSAAAS